MPQQLPGDGGVFVASAQQVAPADPPPPQTASSDTKSPALEQLEEISGLIGQDWGSGWVLAVYQYTQNDNITGGDRDYRVQDFRPFCGVDMRSMNCPSPNVVVPQCFLRDLRSAHIHGCDRAAAPSGS